MRLLKQSSTAQPLLFLMVDSSDNISAKTGLTPTVTLSKNGGSFASPSGAVTEIANGVYKVAGNATDTNTLGPLWLHATGSGADPTDVEFAIVGFDPQVAIPTANQNADALLDRTDGVETSLTLRKALRGFVAVLLSLSGNGGKRFRDFNDTKNRVDATVDSSNNRTGISYDLT